MKQPEELNQAPLVPKEFAGKWIVWNDDETEIVASGKTIAECKQAALRAGVSVPLLQKAPRPGGSFVNGSSRELLSRAI